ncbi:ethylbenzene dehydrogenase-related protein [Aquabacterium humicola]|uniref:ethylbenzene dehydrogenase-related protein n=1 Tax=Aquabacterium humicola TaxID=3237377 RepID=UPI0025439FEE|nr:ethylbenzene dehydrogenase-related protein [Rubrivivax pictus]
MTPRLTTLAVAASFALLGACESPSPPQKAPPNTLVALKTGTAPNPAAGAADPVWSRALPLEVALSDGANFGGTGSTTATLRAAYTGDTLYMLVQYKDPTHSIRRGPYQKQADGSWLQLKDAANKGGDENTYYEDKWAFIWPIANSIKGFDDQGCAALCHKGQGKPYGNKYTTNEGEIGDMWHMKGSRTAPLGHVDDQYVDHTRYDAKTSPNAGRKSDPGGPEYAAFGLANGKPQYMSREARALTAGGTPYIKRGDEVPFDDSRFKAGDEVASYIVNPLQGDRADIRVAVSWKDGVHTSVLSRRLVTGSKFDVQFDKLDARYAFGFAAFDNAQVRHATGDDALFMVFGK